MKTIKLCALFLLCTIDYTDAQNSHEQVFTSIYDKAVWGKNAQGQGFSGGGSLLKHCKDYINYVTQFISSHHIKTIVDAGCGDWEFSKHMNWDGLDYIGYDVVESVINNNINRYAAPNIQFRHANIVTEDLPEADLLICKHVLQHLSNADVLLFMEQISKYRYCLFINEVYPKTLSSPNNDIATGGSHKIDLTKPPFNFKGKKVLNYKIGKAVHQVFLIDNTL